MIRSYGDKSERVRTHVIRVIAPVPIYRKGSQHSASSIRLLCIQGKEMKNHATFTYVADVLVPVLDSCRAVSMPCSRRGLDGPGADAPLGPAPSAAANRWEWPFPPSKK